MLATARRSACRPAPLVGSDAAKVSTAGSGAEGWFMGTRGASEVGLHLKPGLRCARQPGLTTILQGARASLAFYSTVPAFAYAFRHAGCSAVQEMALPRLRLYLRRGGGMARGRHRARHALGGHSSGLVLPGVRGAQGRLRDGRGVGPFRLTKPRAELRKRLQERRVNGCFVWTKRIT